jgi:hypothetical protein
MQNLRLLGLKRHLISSYVPTRIYPLFYSFDWLSHRCTNLTGRRRHQTCRSSKNIFQKCSSGSATTSTRIISLTAAEPNRHRFEQNFQHCLVCMIFNTHPTSLVLRQQPPFYFIIVIITTFFNVALITIVISQTTITESTKQVNT